MNQAGSGRLQNRTAATLCPTEHRLLERGVVTLSAWSNVAYGTPGWWLQELHRRGLMACIWRQTPHGVAFDYTVTPAGRDAYVSYGPPYVPILPTPDVW